METIKRINGYTPNKLKKALIKQYIGEGTDESELTPNQRAFREVFESVEETYKDKDGKEKTRKYYPKFAALSESVANYISEIATSYHGKVYQDKED
jgi:dimeric dUTPase (all-alpha-NTP-PPase superfamily)